MANTVNVNIKVVRNESQECQSSGSLPHLFNLYLALDEAKQQPNLACRP